MTLRTVSPMSCRSPLVRMIGSMDNFNALTFFHSPICSVGCWCFNCVDVVCGSAPPSSSSASYPSEEDVWPSHAFTTASYAVVAVAAFSCLAVVCAASCTTHASATTASFLLFSANCVMCSLASSFFLCATNFFIFVMSGACHFGSHVSSN